MAVQVCKYLFEVRTINDSPSPKTNMLIEGTRNYFHSIVSLTVTVTAELIGIAALQNLLTNVN